MTEKELVVKICEGCVMLTSNALVDAKKALTEGHKKLQAEYDLTIYNLEAGIKEAQIKKDTLPFNTKKTERLLADIAIEKAQKALEYGKIKARSDFEVA